MASLGRTQLLVAALALLLRSAAAQYPMGIGYGMGYAPGIGMGMGYGMGGYGLGGLGYHPGSYGGFGRGYYDDDDDDDRYYGESYRSQPRLTCSQNVTNRLGQVTDAIVATFIEIDDDDDDDDFDFYGYGGLGGLGGYGGYGYGGGLGGYGYPRRRSNKRIKAEIHLLTSQTGTGTLVVTERARVEQGCSTANLGAVYFGDDDDDDDDDDDRGFGLGRIGGFAGGIGFGGMGAGLGLGGFGPGIGYGFGGDFDDDDDDDYRRRGILKSNIRMNQNKQIIYIDELNGFRSLSALAGRGLAMCADASFDFNWQSSCNGPYYGCCVLKYDNRDLSLDDMYDGKAAGAGY